MKYLSIYSVMENSKCCQNMGLYEGCQQSAACCWWYILFLFPSVVLGEFCLDCKLGPNLPWVHLFYFIFSVLIIQVVVLIAFLKMYIGYHLMYQRMYETLPRDHEMRVSFLAWKNTSLVEDLLLFWFDFKILLEYHDE